MVKTFFFSILCVSWFLFITFASLFSFAETITVPMFNIPHMDKLVHFIFYFVLVALGVKAARGIFKENVPLKKVLLYSLLFAFVYGIIIEVLQYMITEDRQGDILDVLANSMGALVGVLIVNRLVSKGWSLK